MTNQSPSTSPIDNNEEHIGLTDTLDNIDSDGNLLNDGLTPSQPQNIDESRVDKVLVEDALNDKDYPTINDIADTDAVAHSHDEDL